MRKWLYMSFMRRLGKRKLEMMYQNLQRSYLQMANEVYGETDESEENSQLSLVEEIVKFEGAMDVKKEAFEQDKAKYYNKVLKIYYFNPDLIEDFKEKE